jgi:ABC-2 type transport system permease protein
MSYLARHLAGVVGVVRRDALLYMSYRMSFLAQCFTAFFSVTMFYYLSRLVTVEGFSSDEYFRFVVVGLVILQAVTGTVGALPVEVRHELVAGTFERLILSPFGAVAGVVSMIVFPFLRAAVLGLVMLLFAVIVFGLRLEWPQALLSIPVAALGALAFTPFSLFFTAAVLAFKQAPGSGVVMALITLLAGLYFPVALLPDWIEWTSEVQPFTPALDLLRHLLVGTELAGSPWLEVLRLVGFAVVLMPVGVLTTAAALRYAQRRGTVTEF